MSDARNQAIAQVESIVDLIRAYNIDFDRLEELRGEKGSYIDERCRYGLRPTGEESRKREWLAARWHKQNPKLAEELQDLESDAQGYESQDAVQEAILEDPLSVEVRSGWNTPWEELQAEEFRIVLCTGGPHVEIVGDLDENNSPSRVRILFRDWGESGALFDFDHDAVMAYAQFFFC